MNTALVEFEKQNKAKWVSSKDLALTVRTNMKNYVQPRYQAFMKTYGELDFSSNKDKYIKYTVEAIGALIDACFIHD